MTKHCDKCGIDYPDEYQFCQKCGSPLRPIWYQPTTAATPQPPQGQPPNKGFDFKVIGGLLGAVIAVVLVLIVLFALGAPSATALSAVGTTAQQDFGGSWSVMKNSTGVAVYIGNGLYNVTLLNGKKETVSYSDLSSQYLGVLSYSTFQPSGGNYRFMPSFTVYPTKVDFVVANGTVNGQNTLIIGVGVYYNTTPNPACYVYNFTNYIMQNSTFSSFISSISANASKYGINFQVGSSNGFDYYFVSTTNQTFLSTTPISGFASQLGFINITAIGTYGEVSTNEEIGIIMINVPPTLSQAQGIASEVEGSL
ncbi:zinc ribbon domain-containing protein [Stygiolobus caldivivus]|uniref:Zinc-ribbon domain-containing protein n=1 Tax=Stygiolobus caldivivus TaxID=2824673 RepID=A0A8D5U6R5_9CREN|nr:zinc ribbon domain-containing protein [Stygiolobus caldivivus]BCU69864.1 hypothetical protein KN1_11610 [Stygiolobus caldivivus]